MTIMEAVDARHSVRQYLAQPLADDVVDALKQAIAQGNAASGLNLQLVCNEPHAFDSFIARYGRFSGVSDYIALVGRQSPNSDEKIGYYGQQVVLLAQQLGLNSCWVGLSYSRTRGAFTVDKGERLRGVIALGYGANEGIPHFSKQLSEVAVITGNKPQWFLDGVECALKAPTAMNQQRFRLSLCGEGVQATAGLGFYSKMDLGIVKCHFEIGSGKGHEIWQ